MASRDSLPAKNPGLGLGEIDSPSSPELKDDCSSRKLLSPSLMYTPSEQSPYQPYFGQPETERSTWQSPASTLTPGPRRFCKSNRNYRQSARTCGNITLLLLAVYSCVLSGIWLGLALAKPHYGMFVRNGGPLPPNYASILAAGFAKSIELAFVCVFIAFLGQFLSRKALSERSDGISISDMMLRTMVLQPGALLVHLRSFLNTWRSFVGITAFIATLSAMFFTTASDALVSPRPTYSHPSMRTLYSNTKTQYANPSFIHPNCPTPVDAKDDEHAANTCMQIEHGGKAYHNYMLYLSKWNSTLKDNNGKIGDLPRPNPTGVLFDNTTIEGSWIHPVDMHDASIRFGRTIDNRTMALPHSGIFEIPQIPKNNMLSQASSDGFGEVTIDASVVSPALNVLCVNASRKELASIVYEEFQDGIQLNTTTWPVNSTIPSDFQNRTDLDDLFGFGSARPPPVFPKYPEPFNSVLNATGGLYPDAIYVLFHSNILENYMMCSLSATLEPGCSTKFNSTFRGASMQTDCDKDNPMAFHSSERAGIRVKDWVTVGSQWALSLSLNDGITDGMSANARLLSQMIPQGITPNDTSPTLAEALAVLAGCTLLKSGLNASPVSTNPFPFPSTDVQSGILLTPTLESFDARVQVRDYASGPQERWQTVFYLVLVSVFLLSAGCVVYFVVALVRRGGLVNDFIEPQNLFSLALNSPGSAQLAGSCGGGPEGAQMLARWYVRMDRYEHVFVADAETARAQMMGPGQGLEYGGADGNFGGAGTPGIGTPAGFREQFDVEKGGKGRVNESSPTLLSPELASPGLVNPVFQRQKYSRLESSG